MSSEPPGTQRVPAYAEPLARADAALRAGDLREAADAFTVALQTAAHRELHFDALRSPLADGPAAVHRAAA